MDGLSRQSSTDCFCQLFEQSPMGIAIVDLDYRIAKVNETLCRMVGYTQEEITGKQFIEITHPEDIDSDLQLADRVFSGEIPYYKIEKRYIKKNQEILWVKLTASVIREEHGVVLYGLAIVEDISEFYPVASFQRANKLEQACPRLAFHLENSPLAVIEWDNQSRVQFWSQQAEKIFGWKAEEVLGKFWHEWKFVVEEDIEKVQDNAAGLRTGINPKNVLYNRNYTKEGHILDIEWYNSTLFDELGQVISVLSLALDITPRIKAETSLRESEERFRLLVESMNDIIFTLDPQQRHTGVYGNALEEYGLTPEFFQGKTAREILGIEAASIHEAANEKALTGEKTLYDWSLSTHQGTHYFQTLLSPLRNEQGDIFGIVGVGRDMTEYKQMDHALQERENLFRAIFEQAAVGIAQLSISGQFIKVNQKFCDILGYSTAELSTKNYRDITAAESQDISRQFIKELWENKTRYFSLEKKYITPHGSNVWGHVTVSMIRSLSGEPEYFLAVLQEISDRKKIEEALRASQLKYQTLFQILPLGISISDTEGNIIEANPASEKILDVPTDQHISRSCQDSQWQILRRDRTPMPPSEFAGVRALRENKVIENMEMGLIKSQGNLCWMSVTAAPIPLEGYGVAIAYVDITQRQQAEEALLIAQARFQRLLTSSPAIIYSCDIYEHHNLTFISENITVILGYKIEEILTQYRFWQNHLHPDDRFLREKKLTDILAENSQSYEYRFRHKNGTYRWLYDELQVQKDLTGNPLEIVGFCMDITERKEAEKIQLQQSERERIIWLLTQRIRQTLKLEEVLNTTVKEVRDFLECDRVIIHCFQREFQGKVLVESLAPGWTSTLDWEINEPWTIDKEFIWKYESGYLQKISDIYGANLEKKYLQLLENFQVRASLIVPILLKIDTENVEIEEYFLPSNYQSITPNFTLPSAEKPGLQLWGFLIAHQCSGAREWQPFEVDLLQQLADQLAIAIQQLQLYQKLKLANKKLQKLADLDGLTQVPNRRKFDNYISQEWRRMLREKMPLSLILCDVDFFKLYNDTYGHQAGDECLKKVAQAMQNTIKRPGDLVARYGGEEFAIILPNTPMSGAFHIAEEIRANIVCLDIDHEKSQVCDRVTVSLGIASLIPEPELTPEMLIATADLALYRAKEQGRNCVVFLNSPIP
jgi:diguanylate cyclase (GGDEF)-like protein/PAS domain S-box-containing protein